MSLLVALPVVLPLAAAALLWVLARWPAVQRGVAVGANVAVFIVALGLLRDVWTRGIQVHWLSGWPPPFGIVLVGDLLSASLVAMTSGVFLAALAYSFGYIEDGALRWAYLPLLFFLMAGVHGALLTGDLFNLFVFFEVMLLAIYGLVISPEAEGLIPRREKLEATFKYLILNLIGAAVMLLAIASLYGTTGTLNMADLAVRIAAARAEGAAHLDLVALLFVVVFGLKAAAVPFHFWLPDVHPSAPAPVSALLSGILIKVGAYGLIRLTTLLFGSAAFLSEVVLLLAVVTLLLGAVLALGQLDLKRFLAYSSVSQMGFLLLGVGLAGNGFPAAVRVQGLAAGLFFLMNHALIKSMLFLAAGGVMHVTHERSMANMGGLQGASPFLAGAFLVGTMALAGMPPLNGFVSKLLVFQALLAANRLPYVLAALVGAFLGLTYVFRAWLTVFWGRSRGMGRAPLRATQALPIAVLAGFCLLWGLFAEPLVLLANETAAQALNPDLYVEAVLEGSP